VTTGYRSHHIVAPHESSIRHQVLRAYTMSRSVNAWDEFGCGPHPYLLIFFKGCIGSLSESVGSVLDRPGIIHLLLMMVTSNFNKNLGKRYRKRDTTPMNLHTSRKMVDTLSQTELQNYTILRLAKSWCQSPPRSPTHICSKHSNLHLVRQ
jgi:hypothetical protein